MDDRLFETLSSEFHDCMKANASIVRADKPDVSDETMAIIEKNYFELFGKVCSCVAPYVALGEMFTAIDHALQDTPGNVMVIQKKPNREKPKPAPQPESRRTKLHELIEKHKREDAMRPPDPFEEERREALRKALDEEQAVASASTNRWCVTWLDGDVTKSEVFDDEIEANRFAATCGGTVFPIQDK